MRHVFLLDQSDELYDRLADLESEIHQIKTQSYFVNYLSKIRPSLIVLHEGYFPLSPSELIDYLVSHYVDHEFLDLIMIYKKPKQVTFLRVSHAIITSSASGSSVSDLVQSIRDYIDWNNTHSAYSKYTEILSTLAHDLKGPLTSIMLGTRMLNSCPEYMRSRYTETIYSSCRQQLHVIDTLLDWFRVESHQFHQQQIEEIDLSEFFSRFLADYIQRFSQVDKSIVFTSDLHCVKRRTDVMLLRRVVSELLENALKYAPKYTDTQVSIQTDKDSLVICTSNPAEINSEDLTILCQPFARGSNSSGSPGTGLGLYVLSNLLENSGGSLETSLNDSILTFRVKLPGVQG